jgi:hypothetical protein
MTISKKGNENEDDKIKEKLIESGTIRSLQEGEDGHGEQKEYTKDYLLKEAYKKAMKIQNWYDCRHIEQQNESMEANKEQNIEYDINLLALQIANYQSEKETNEFSQVQKLDALMIYPKIEIRFTYKKQNGDISNRFVSSMKCFYREGHWYLTGIEVDEGPIKSFRFDRIEEMKFGKDRIDDYFSFFKGWNQFAFSER